MRKVYERWITEWENRLMSVSTNRKVRPFEWGEDWSRSWPAAQRIPQNGHSASDYLKLINRESLDASSEFYAYKTPADFRLADLQGKERLLEFTSPVKTPYPENNLARAQWFPAMEKAGKRGTKRKRVAVVVLPHWNASVTQHNSLCAGLAKLGISALRLSLPYHDYRMPPELERADYAVSSNVGRTVDAGRQAVIDTRCCVDWLEQRGFESIGIVGTSLGSCYAFLASVHDPRLKVNVFNHCSTYFADVVWEGLSTRHIRESLEPSVSLDDLREAWSVISPPYYIERFAEMNKNPLFIYTKYDTTFPTRFSEQVIAKAKELGFRHKAVVLPCGHYTLGQTPFKFVCGYQICSFLKRSL